jgi:hypothetical protein
VNTQFASLSGALWIPPPVPPGCFDLCPTLKCDEVRRYRLTSCLTTGRAWLVLYEKPLILQDQHGESLGPTLHAESMLDCRILPEGKYVLKLEPQLCAKKLMLGAVWRERWPSASTCPGGHPAPRIWGLAIGLLRTCQATPIR